MRPEQLHHSRGAWKQQYMIIPQYKLNMAENMIVDVIVKSKKDTPP